MTETFGIDFHTRPRRAFNLFNAYCRGMLENGLPLEDAYLYARGFWAYHANPTTG